MMVGCDLDSFYKKQYVVLFDYFGLSLLLVCDMVGGLVKGCFFDLYFGEVLGIVGLVGLGCMELVWLIYGVDVCDGGCVVLQGCDIDILILCVVLDVGIVYLIEDCVKLGLFLDMLIFDNVNIGVIVQDVLGVGLLDFCVVVWWVGVVIKVLVVKVLNVCMFVGGLLGGNQQKVLIVWLLEIGFKVVILDELMCGVDVGVKFEIYKLIDQLVCNGVGVVMILSELVEIIGVVDCVLVMCEGYIVGEVMVLISQEVIMELLIGMVWQLEGVI